MDKTLDLPNRADGIWDRVLVPQFEGYSQQ